MSNEPVDEMFCTYCIVTTIFALMYKPFTFAMYVSVARTPKVVVELPAPDAWRGSEDSSGKSFALMLVVSHLLNAMVNKVQHGGELGDGKGPDCWCSTDE